MDMALLLLFLVVIGFVLFFYGIGLRYIALIPLLFVAGFFGYYGATQTIKVQGKDLLRKYSLYIAWIIILAGLVGVGNFFGLDMTTNVMVLMWCNVVLWIMSQLINYHDGKIVFQIGYYIMNGVLLWMALTWGWAPFFHTLAIMRALRWAIIAFMIFVVGMYQKVDQYFWYMFGISTLGIISSIIFEIVPNMYGALVINGAILTGLSLLLYKVYQYHPISANAKKEVSVRRILAGERITQTKTYMPSKTKERIYQFVADMPEWTKQILEAFNSMIILVLIIRYSTHIGQFASINHLLYWIVIINFIVNVILLKKIKYNSIFQNLMVFLVINFAIYASLFSIFQGNIWSVVSRGIFRNIYSAAMIFYAHKVPMLAKIFTKTDYIYRIISNVIAMIVNVVLLIATPLAGELIFFLILVYIGIETMIIFYAAKYLSKQQLDI